MSKGTAIAIRINRTFQDYGHGLGYEDLDGFGLRLAASIEGFVQSGETVQRACSDALAAVNTQFFRVNRISRQAFGQEFCPRLKDVVKEFTLQEQILVFKTYSERQLAGVLKEGDEEGLRSNLQSFLAGNFLTFREVPSGRGRTDIFIVEPYREVIETKVWRGEANFDDGLTELSQYLQKERLDVGYYVVIEFGQAERFLADKAEQSWIENRDSKQIIVTFIRIPSIEPSKLGRERRRAQKKESRPE
jgi:hypothetical protein